MKYVSTRGNSRPLNFEETIIAGLASDGGLYVPETIPTFSKEKILSFKGLSYEELVFEIISPFIDGEINDEKLKEIIATSYANFRHDEIAPLKKIGKNEYLLELFHGPTLAFKDFALQFLGQIFDYFLKKRKQHVAIIGATSGDTGSAAIDGCCKSENVEIFIMHPHNRVSDVQRLQMTTILADNVHNIALQGNFDDCQEIVKELFRDESFLKGKKMVAVNSINWCRIMAQIVYYFYSALKLDCFNNNITYSVPTGNFGDIFAGFLATKMGLPIKKLVVATNGNDILHRFFENNDYSRSDLQKTLSPSMDIQVSSNFERFLYYLHDENGSQINDIMDKFKSENIISLSNDKLNKAREIFASGCVSDNDTCETIANIYKNTGEIIDPHTAIGVKAARNSKNSTDDILVTLATAHPAKFPEANKKANVPESSLPNHLSDLFEKPEKFTVLDNDIEVIRKFVADN